MVMCPLCLSARWRSLTKDFVACSGLPSTCWGTTAIFFTTQQTQPRQLLVLTHMVCDMLQWLLSFLKLCAQRYVLCLMMPNVNHRHSGLISENQHPSSHTTVRHLATRQQIELVSFGPEGHGWEHWRRWRSKLQWVYVSVSSDLLQLPQGNSWNRWCAGWVGRTDFILHGFCKHISFCQALVAFHFLCTRLLKQWLTKWGLVTPTHPVSSRGSYWSYWGTLGENGKKLRHTVYFVFINVIHCAWSQCCCCLQSQVTVKKSLQHQPAVTAPLLHSS